MSFKTESLNALANQANVLVRSHLKFNALESRIFALALGCVNFRTNMELPDIDIAVEDILREGRGGQQYKLIDAATDSLMKKFAKVAHTMGKHVTWTKYSLISKLEFDSRTGRLTGRFSSDIKPFLLELNGQFTRVELEILLSLQSAHAQRIYWIMQSYESVGHATIKVELLRRYMLGDDYESAYPLYSAFKANVLTPALKELAALERPWLIVFEERKDGRKIDEVFFTIPANPNAATLIEAALPSPTKTLTLSQIEEFRAFYLTRQMEAWARTYDRMRADYKLTEPQAREAIKAARTEEQLKQLNLILRQVQIDAQDGKVKKTLGGYTLTRIKEVFPIYQKMAKSK